MAFGSRIWIRKKKIKYVFKKEKDTIVETFPDFFAIHYQFCSDDSNSVKALFCEDLSPRFTQFPHPPSLGSSWYSLKMQASLHQFSLIILYQGAKRYLISIHKKQTSNTSGPLQTFNVQFIAKIFTLAIKKTKQY